MIGSLSGLSSALPVSNTISPGRVRRSFFSTGLASAAGAGVGSAGFGSAAGAGSAAGVGSAAGAGGGGGGGGGGALASSLPEPKDAEAVQPIMAGAVRPRPSSTAKKREL